MRGYELMRRERCWVWFKGGLTEEGHWMSGWVASTAAEGGLLIENPSYVACRVPEWRVVFKEPSDLNQPPQIPDNPIWKLV